MSPGAESQTPGELLRQARIAYYDKGDDKACARFLWDATFRSIQQLAEQMGHPCETVTRQKSSPGIWSTNTAARCGILSQCLLSV